jgi:DNA-binding LacI/PurR family transcriptional regulator
VSTDNFLGGYLATQHLIELGHERIAVLAGRTELSTHSARVDGYRKAMLAAHLPVRDEHWHPGSMQAHAGYEFGQKLFKLPEPPTAVFCTNNKLLLGFVRAMSEVGARCPEEISVVGFDDSAWTENFHPRLTTVAQPARELGRQAMQLLLDRIENKVDESVNEPRKVVLKPELHIRESTAPALLPMEAVGRHSKTD